MKVLGFNGSPRINWNTSTLVEKALEGAASQGAEVELIHLYDLNYKGCLSCFFCKLKNGKNYGKCATVDDLTPILEKVEDADAIILGSPVYFGSASGEMKSFIERMTFPYLVYDANFSSLFKKKINIGLIYTMNVNESRMKEMGYNHNFDMIEMFLKRTFGSTQTLLVTDTYQFSDYSKYVSTAFNVETKAKRREEEFPKDCQKAFKMGESFITQAAI